MVTIPVLEDPTIGPAGVVWDASIVLAQHVLDAGLGPIAIHASGNSGSRDCDSGCNHCGMDVDRDVNAGSNMDSGGVSRVNAGDGPVRLRR